jgi:enoyl-CoA hydratase
MMSHIDMTSVPPARQLPWTLATTGLSKSQIVNQSLRMSRAKYLQMSGNVITGKLAADWGWATKSFPSEQFDDMFTREVTALASIAPDMLAASKLSLNQAYDIMGMRTSLHAVTPWHHASARTRPGAGEFRRMANEQGLKAAVQWRDAAFKDIDAPSVRKKD